MDVDVYRRYYAYVQSDNPFQRQARLLQSVWRAEQGYPPGEHRGQPAGARLPMPWARDTLANFLTGTARQTVRAEVACAGQAGKLIAQPRIYDNLLSSQPLCFNLFAELKHDLPLASAVTADLTGKQAARVTRLEFEHSPGRGDPRYTGDHSAFDVYIEYTLPAGARGFLGVEVKYHENLAGGNDRHRPRYDEVAGAMGCFRPDALPLLRQPPLEQIWRDHLLAGALQHADDFDEGAFVFLYPEGNRACASAAARYGDCLNDHATFRVWTLEAVVAALMRHTSAEWVDRFANRYLRFDRLARL